MTGSSPTGSAFGQHAVYLIVSRIQGQAFTL
jgi:hypothetical protein